MRISVLQAWRAGSDGSVRVVLSEHLRKELVQLIRRGAHGEGCLEKRVAPLQVPVFHPAEAGQYYCLYQYARDYGGEHGLRHGEERLVKGNSLNRGCG